MAVALIKASVVIIALLGFYKLLLEKESFFRANRIYLLSCLLFAFLLPFVGLPEISQHQGYVTSLLDSPMKSDVEPLIKSQPAPSEVESIEEQCIREELKNETKEFDNTSKRQETLADTEPSAQANATSYWSKLRLKDILLLIYFVGVIALALRLIKQVFQTLKNVRRTEDKIEDEGMTVVNLSGDIDPCSFFKYIFINPEKYDYETYEQILSHERIHVKQRHSIDLLLAEIAIILMWFNPFIWVLRKEIEKNIEYQTDDLLVNGASDIRENYQMNLVKIANGNKPLVVTTNYNQSLIKQRILKMNNVKSNNQRYWKYTLIAPIVLGLVVFLNKPNTSYAGVSTSEEGLSEPRSIESNSNDFFGLFVNSCHALTQAVRDEDIEEVERRLKRTSPNCVDPEPGYEMWESEDGRFTFRRSQPRTPLATAAKKGNLEIGKMLLEAGAKVDYDRDDHGSALTEAASYGRLEFVKFLEENGADLDHMSDGQGSSLHCAARKGHLETVKYLLSRGVPLNRQNDGQGTPLNGAARNGHVEVIAYLIEEGAEVNRQNDGQGSALNAAARNGHVEAAKLLIEKGAEVNLQNDGQGSPLNAAARNGNVEMIELLLDNGARINRQNDGQGSALNAAARNSHVEAAKLLLEYGADIDRQNDGQGSPLNAAARNGHMRMVKFLLSEGADVNRQNDGQGSALNAAARNGHLDVVKILIENGANVNQRNDGQGTALDAALRNRHKRVASYLRSQGAR